MENQIFLTLNNDVKMLAFGFGIFRSDENEASKSLEIALRNGYRLIDTASIYGNEEEVAKEILASGVSREDLFITTKLWISDYGYDSALSAFEESLQKLQTDYLSTYTSYTGLFLRILKQH